MEKVNDTIIIGGGQAGMSAAFFLRRQKIDFLLLDDQSSAGGAWNHTWDSLHLFSPADYSSLSGWQLPATKETYPTKNEFLTYLQAYEKRYEFQVHRNTLVTQVTYANNLFTIDTNNNKQYHCKTLISATGTAKNPYIPTYPNQALFKGLQIHSVDYKNADSLKNKKVLIVGGGNSGAQILAEVSKVAPTTWVTKNPPNFLPDDIDGRYLFNQANNQFYGKPTEGKTKSLSDIVMIDSVKEARERGVLNAHPLFKDFFENGVVWEDGKKEAFDAVIWCTGFKANLGHLNDLNLEQNGKIIVKGSQSVKYPNLWLLGYGNWTGFASATIYGVGKTARETAIQIKEYLHPSE